MNINVLKVRNFRRFRNFELRFSKGVNLIYGPNESGKSTLIDAIVMLFYVDPRSRSREVLGNKNWAAEELFRIEMGFRVYDTPLYLIKDFQTRKASLHSPDREIGNVDRINRIMAEIVGIDNSDVYIKTACIRQDELNQIKKLPARLEQFIMGGVDIARLLRKVDEKRRALKVERSGRGRILELRRQSEEMERKRAELKRRLDERQDVLARLRVVQDKLSSQSEVYEKMKAKMDLDEELKDTEKQIDELYKEKEEFRKMEFRKERLREQLAQFNGIEDDIKELERIERQRDIRKSKRNMWRYLLGVSVAGIIAGFSLFFVNKGAIIVSIVAMIFSSIGYWRIHKVYGEERELGERFFRILARRRVGGCEELKELETGKHKLVVESARLDERLKQFSPEDMEKELHQLETRRQELLKEFETLRYVSVDLSEFCRMGREIPVLSEERNRLERRLEVLDEFLKDQPAIVDLEEEMDSLRAEIDRLERNYEIYSILYAKLEETKQDLIMEINSRLNERMREYVSRFTKGRYSKIRCISSGRNELQIMVYSNEKKDWVDAGELSTGTTDQIYLATRLVFLETIAGQKRPPIILDDPFTFFDEDRLMAAFDVLKELATNYQVLLFTCNPVYTEYFPDAIRIGIGEKAMEVE